MLSISNVSPKHGADYFKEDNYYSKDEAKEQSKWSGSGAEALGLEGKVDSESFQNLLEGKSPDGKKLLRGKKINPQKHRAGFDLTFSAPKSVSMAVLMGRDKQLDGAHRIAVERTLKIIERQYAQARVWDGKQQQKVNTGNLIVAQFHHTTSREKDPQLHTHCVLINSTQLENGKWRALTNEELYNQKMLLGAIYRNELAYEARKLGYEVEPRKDDLFEIKGYTQFQLDWFSKRRQQILELVGADASAVTKQWAAIQTRAKKGKELPREEQLGWWQAQNEAFNLQIKHPVPQPTAQVEDTTAAATTSVKEAIEHCSERTVAFKRRMLEKFIFNEIRQFSYAELEEALANDPELLSTFDQRFTTQAAVNRELDTIRLMQQGQEQVKSIATTDIVNDYLENKTLTAGQEQAISLAATTTNQFIGWQGVAGAGKTYALNEFREIAQAQGYILKGYAPSSEAAKVLGEEVGIESTTVASLIETKQPEEIQPNQIWIVDEAGLLSAKDAHALLQRATDQQARVVLVGDTRQLSAVEAGNPFKSLQQALMQTAHLNQSLRQRTLDLQEAVDLIASGQIQQGIEKLNAHNRIAVIPDSEERFSQLVADYMAVAPESREKTLVLAGTNAERLQITQLIRTELKNEKVLGKTARLTQLKPKDLTQVQARYTHHYTVGDVVVPTREYKRLGLSKFQPYAITAIDQNQLSLRSIDGDITKVDPMAFRKTVYTPQSIEIAVGDRLKWTRNNKQLGQRNGQEFKVIAIDNNLAQIQYKNGLTDSIDLSKLNHLDYALVSTTYSSQGKTADRVLIAADQTLGKESFYVATSRAKYDLKIYAEDEATLLKLALKSKAKENPMELIKSQRTKLAASATTTNDAATPVSPPTTEEDITHGRTDEPTEPTESTEQLKSGDGEGTGRRTVLRLDAHSRTARPNRRLGERPTTNKPRTVKPSPRTNQPTTSRPRPRLATSGERTRLGGGCYDKISRPTTNVGARPQSTTNTINRMVKRVSSQSSPTPTVSSPRTEVRQHHAGLQRLSGNSHPLVKRLESSSGTNAAVTGAVTPEPIFRAGQSDRQSNAELQQLSDSVNPHLQGFESAIRDIAAVGAGAPPDASQPKQSNRHPGTEDQPSAPGVEPVSHNPNPLVEDLATSNRAVGAWGTTTQPAVGATEQPLRQPTVSSEQFDAGLRQFSDHINVQLRNLESTGRSDPAAEGGMPTDSSASEQAIQQSREEDRKSSAWLQPERRANRTAHPLRTRTLPDVDNNQPAKQQPETNSRQPHPELQRFGTDINALVERLESDARQIDEWGTQTTSITSTPEQSTWQSGTEFDSSIAQLEQIDQHISTDVKWVAADGRTIQPSTAPTLEPTQPAPRQLGTGDKQSVTGVEQVDQHISSLVESLESNSRTDESSRPAPVPAVRDTDLPDQQSRPGNEQFNPGSQQYTKQLDALVPILESSTGTVDSREARTQSTDAANVRSHLQPGAANGQPTAGNGNYRQQLRRISSQLGGVGTSIADINSQTQQHSLTEIATRLGLEAEANNPSRWKGAGVVVDIEGDRFYSHSSQRQGGGSIAFIMQVRHCSYRQAINWLKQGAPAVKRTEQQTTQANKLQPPVPSFTPPVADEQQWSQVRRYLVEQRHLPAQLLDELHETGYVYADNAGNAVFLQVANQGRITRANLLSTNSDRSLPKVASGSLSGDGWFQFSQGSGKLTRIVLTDSPVNAMSLAAVDQGQQQDRTVYISVDATQNVPALRSFAAQGVRVEVAFGADTIGERKARQVINSVPGAKEHKSSVGKTKNEQLRPAQNRQTTTQLKSNEATQKQPRLTLQERMLQEIQHDRTQYKRESQSDLKLVVEGLIEGHSFQQIKNDIDQQSALVQHWKKSDDYATAVNKTIKYTQQLCEEAPTLPAYYQQLYKKYVSDIQKQKGYLQPNQMDLEVAIAALKSYPEYTVRSILKHTLTARVHGEEYVQQTLEQAQRLQLEAQVKQQQPQNNRTNQAKGFELAD